MRNELRPHPSIGIREAGPGGSRGEMVARGVWLVSEAQGVFSGRKRAEIVLGHPRREMGIPLSK